MTKATGQFQRGVRLGLAITVAIAFMAGASALVSMPAAAAALKTYTKQAAFEDVHFELTNIIVDRGLKVDSNGRISAMLDRTGADVGSTRAIYKKAEYFTFCSAVLSRKMMEADPLNVGLCPYVMFIYVAVGKPDEVVVGYRVVSAAGSAASMKSYAAINKLLDGIVKEAVQ